MTNAIYRLKARVKKDPENKEAWIKLLCALRKAKRLDGTELALLSEDTGLFHDTDIDKTRECLVKQLSAAMREPQGVHEQTVSRLWHDLAAVGGGSVAMPNGEDRVVSVKECDNNARRASCQRVCYTEDYLIREIGRVILKRGREDERSTVIGEECKEKMRAILMTGKRENVRTLIWASGKRGTNHCATTKEYALHDLHRNATNPLNWERLGDLLVMQKHGGFVNMRDGVKTFYDCYERAMSLYDKENAKRQRIH